MESDAPIALYYERLASVQSRGCQVTHQVLRDILKEVQLTLVPEVLLKEWAQYTYQDPSDYWTFRKQVLKHLSPSYVPKFIVKLTSTFRYCPALYSSGSVGFCRVHIAPHKTGPGNASNCTGLRPTDYLL